MTIANSAPRTRLETHTVENQPPPFAGRNLYLTDLALREAVRREAGDWLDGRASALGALAGSEEVLALGEAANRNKPELVSFDRYGVADAFCARHFGEGAGLTYGTLPAAVDVAAIIRRQLNC
jgi:Adaptive response protein AidB N-terminal domain